MADEDYAQNITALKSIAFRGLRSFIVLGGGIAVLTYSLRRRRLAAEAVDVEAAAVAVVKTKTPTGQSSGSPPSSREDDADPTARYLKEMESIGWDVQGHEDELRKERDSRRSNRQGREKSS